MTSILVRNFRDGSPIKSMNDKRLEENNSFLVWLEEWEKKKAADSDKNNLFCPITVFGLKFMIIGFNQLCKIILKKYPEKSILANKINTDAVENFFSQVRARNGQNDNPRLIEYGMYMNNIALLIRVATYSRN